MKIRLTKGENYIEAFLPRGNYLMRIGEELIYPDKPKVSFSVSGEIVTATSKYSFEQIVNPGNLGETEVFRWFEVTGDNEKVKVIASYKIIGDDDKPVFLKISQPKK